MGEQPGGQDDRLTNGVKLKLARPGSYRVGIATVILPVHCPAYGPTSSVKTTSHNIGILGLTNLTLVGTTEYTSILVNTFNYHCGAKFVVPRYSSSK